MVYQPPESFLRCLLEFDCDSVTDEMLKKVKVYTDGDFDIEKMADSSRVSEMIGVWVLAVVAYCDKVR